MKTMKKLFAVLLVAAMTIVSAMPAFAADQTVTTPPTVATAKGAGNFSITLTDAEAGHVFDAFQVFDAAVDTAGKLSDITWGSGVTDTDAIITELQSITEFAGLANDASAADVAKILATVTDDSTVAQQVATIFAEHKNTVAGTATADATKTAVITGLKAGYYLVIDNGPAGSHDAISRNILAVVGDVTAEMKKEVPSIDKKIIDKGNKVDANNTGIGDTVAYEITGTVPNYTGYDNYFYVINDTLSDGLTFDGAQNVVVKVGDTTLVQGTDYVVYTGADATPYTFQVAFKNIKAYTIGDPITVTYTATVNENAVIGNTGNPNTVTLTYSNNPNDSGNGNPSDNPKPGTDTPTGTTPEEKTLTFVTEVDLTKYADSITAGKELAGAEFTLTGTSEITVASTADSYVVDTNGIYYKLQDGTFTTAKPHGDITDSAGTVVVTSNEASYASTTTTYRLTSATTYTVQTKEVCMTATTDENGKLSFKGLGAGTYTLTETKTPDGYNTVDPITFTITVTVPETVTTGTETATWASNNAAVVVNGTGIFATDVIDLSGSVLPSTGGMGTTIFYVVGFILLAGAGVMLIARKRMSVK